jgi:RNA polymerase sigma-70 factor (ECF subfamily)
MGLYGERLSRQIRSRMGRRVGSLMAAEDVYQETFLRALGAIGKFRWQGEESFYLWLAGIAEHLIRSASQKKSLDTLCLTRDVPASDATPSKTARRDERFDRLECSINKLSPDQRTALKLARIDGLPVREIATKMERSEKAVYALLSRALDRLQETFGDTESLHLPDRAFQVKEAGDDS